MKVAMDFESLEGTSKPTQGSNELADSLLSKYMKIHRTATNRSNRSHQYKKLEEHCIDAVIDKKFPVNVIQEIIDRGASMQLLDLTVNFSGSLVYPFSYFLSAMMNHTEDTSYALDLTTLGLARGLGCDVKDKYIHVVGEVGPTAFWSARNVNAQGSIFHRLTFQFCNNCVVQGDIFGFDVGKHGKNSTFIGKTFLDQDDLLKQFTWGGGVGEYSTNCEFHADEMADISKHQDGSSRYFIRGVEIAYEHHINGDMREKVVRHEP